MRFVSALQGRSSIPAVDPWDPARALTHGGSMAG